jgi:hypothetical protein
MTIKLLRAFNRGRFSVVLLRFEDASGLASLGAINMPSAPKSDLGTIRLSLLRNGLELDGTDADAWVGAG